MTTSVLTTIPEDECCFRENGDDADSCNNISNFSSEFRDMAHLVAAERRDRHLPALHRSAALDRLALQHAQTMATKRAVHHSVARVEELQRRLASENVGENVQRGDSVWSMHRETMEANAQTSINRANIVSEHFDEFGSAMAFGRDGKIYSCQVFRKR